jgi:tetratricopeptide (TPR) repeat protein
MKMKKQILLVIALMTIYISNAQDAKYVKAMEKNIALIDSAGRESSASVFQDAYNSFERIAGANPKEWLPLYYQAYCEVMMGLGQKENLKKDEYFDKADALAGKADSLQPNNSEIFVMKSFITSMKISVDPQSRGQQLGMKSGILLGKAMQLDPENPRAYFLKGQGLVYTPEQFGGGKDKAIPVLETAVQKYAKFKPASSIMPHWGEAKCKATLAECKK